MKDVLKAAFKKAGYKIDNKTILAESFFVLQGLFTGIALNDIWRILNLPGNNQPINVAGTNGLMDVDFLYQLTIAGLAAGAQIIFKVDHGISFAAGIALGSTWANLSENGHYIGSAGALQKAPSIPPGTPQVQPLPIASSLTFQGPYNQMQPMNSPLTIAPAPPYNPLTPVRLNAPLLT